MVHCLWCLLLCPPEGANLTPEPPLLALWPSPLPGAQACGHWGPYGCPGQLASPASSWSPRLQLGGLRTPTVSGPCAGHLESRVGTSAHVEGPEWQKPCSVVGVVGCPSNGGSEIPAATSGAGLGRNQVLRGGARGSEELVCCPPPPGPLPASLSLGTKQSLLSNFKCYLRTAWPQPKAALWKLVFRCRGCKYQRLSGG